MAQAMERRGAGVEVESAPVQAKDVSARGPGSGPVADPEAPVSDAATAAGAGGEVEGAGSWEVDSHLMDAMGLGDTEQAESSHTQESPAGNAAGAPPANDKRKAPGKADKTRSGTAGVSGGAGTPAEGGHGKGANDKGAGAKGASDKAAGAKGASDKAASAKGASDKAASNKGANDKAHAAGGRTDGVHPPAGASEPSSAAPVQAVHLKEDSARASDVHAAPVQAVQRKEDSAAASDVHAAPDGIAGSGIAGTGSDANLNVQRRAHEDRTADVHAAAAQGVSGSSGPLPHLDAIQRSFGRHDVSQVQAHADGAAAAGAAAMGAEAFATGNHIAFRQSPSLHTAAHEAAHVVQQRGGVQLKGGVGQTGDAYERHADAVADRVVQGRSAEDLLDHAAGASGRSGIQRKDAGDSVQMETHEFIPTFNTVPTATQLKLFGKKTQTFKITNARAAPPRTTFNWGGGIQGTALKLGEIAEHDHGATKDFPVQADLPGEDSIQGTPQHQVPGGPLVTGATQRIAVTVPVPTQRLLSTVHLRGGAQIEPALDHCSVGDQLRYRIEIGNIDGRNYPESGASVAFSGSGAIRFDTARRVQVLPNAHIYDVTGTCTGIGPVNGNLDVAVLVRGTGNMFGPPALIRCHVEMDRAQFLQQCANCNTAIDLADRKTEAWLASIANAYAMAWTKHTTVLTDQDASNRLAGQLILGAALAFIPGGIGGLVGASMKTLTNNNDFLVDGIKDLAKWGLREAGGSLAAGPAPAMQAYPTDPLQWQNRETIRIKSELAVATARLLDWQTKATRNDPDFIMSFDPITAMQDALKVKGQAASALEPVDSTSYADKFERGFWKGWLENFAYSGHVTMTKAGPRLNKTENNGKKIKERCEKLGLDWRPYAKVSEDRVDQEAAAMADSGWGVR